ncbi:hypothetical protein PVAP13_4KG311600 [Panicum virgatum]|uniref:Uncharacterized protein n=1 Tax=Panicum virgatum TaxID=38727 RepID=A0A8T0TUL1_PANVG|nr:hypothetical protein PVAP13_4KG311600 [Panicum virgatum]KAG2612865.1 hypothetical protein PVAP13_4KG311600 [Panicum virgatum]KAG2612866.1 hypothetical protein PVAP13_4KG311600 [Panicum virgatum]KAG2612867.1 hypothetical protein PVAP13_4KG311600 [Panicum virgatum]KAG2612868.1 hypothetical protein PVAP13_4KG311600 [Panicum virgatum]
MIWPARCASHGSPPSRRRRRLLLLPTTILSSPSPSHPPSSSSSSPPPTPLLLADLPSLASPPPPPPSHRLLPAADKGNRARRRRGPSSSFPPSSSALPHSVVLARPPLPTGFLLLPAAAPSPCRHLTARHGGGQRRRHRAAVWRQTRAPAGQAPLHNATTVGPSVLRRLHHPDPSNPLVAFTSMTPPPSATPPSDEAPPPSAPPPSPPPCRTPPSPSPHHGRATAPRRTNLLLPPQHQERVQVPGTHQDGRCDLKRISLAAICTPVGYNTRPLDTATPSTTTSSTPSQCEAN